MTHKTDLVAKQKLKEKELQIAQKRIIDSENLQGFVDSKEFYIPILKRYNLIFGLEGEHRLSICNVLSKIQTTKGELVNNATSQLKDNNETSQLKEMLIEFQRELIKKLKQISMKKNIFAPSVYLMSDRQIFKSINTETKQKYAVIPAAEQAIINYRKHRDRFFRKAQRLTYDKLNKFVSEYGDQTKIDAAQNKLQSLHTTMMKEINISNLHNKLQQAIDFLERQQYSKAKWYLPSPHMQEAKKNIYEECIAKLVDLQFELQSFKNANDEDIEKSKSDISTYISDFIKSNDNVIKQKRTSYFSSLLPEGFFSKGKTSTEIDFERLSKMFPAAEVSPQKQNNR